MWHLVLDEEATVRLHEGKMLPHHLVFVIIAIKVVAGLIVHVGARLRLGGLRANVNHLHNSQQVTCHNERALPWGDQPQSD